MGTTTAHRGRSMLPLVLDLVPVLVLVLGLALFTTASANARVHSPQTKIEVQNRRLLVNGQRFQIKGVAYSPTPIGDDPEHHRQHGDYFTLNYKRVYQRDLPILRSLGVNALRLYTWDYTKDHTDFLDSCLEHGIYVVPSYFVPQRTTDEPLTQKERQKFLDDVRQLVKRVGSHPAILMYIVGNELNGDWNGFIKAFGGDTRDGYRQLSQFINGLCLEAITTDYKENQAFHPVMSSFADTSDIDLKIKNWGGSFDSWMPNCTAYALQLYRGRTFDNPRSGDSPFDIVRDRTTKPLVLTEYGVDAYDYIRLKEDEATQADYLGELASTLQENDDVSWGGFVMEYSDEWWKSMDSSHCKPSPITEAHLCEEPQRAECPEYDPAKQTPCGYENPSLYDKHLSEEWFGLVRISATSCEIDKVEPRQSFYTLQQIYRNLDEPEYPYIPEPCQNDNTLLRVVSISVASVIAVIGLVVLLHYFIKKSRKRAPPTPRDMWEPLYDSQVPSSRPPQSRPAASTAPAAADR